MKVSPGTTKIKVYEAGYKTMKSFYEELGVSEATFRYWHQSKPKLIAFIIKRLEEM